MANNPSSLKRARQTPKRNAHNSSLRSRARTAVKRVIQSIKSGSHTDAQLAFKKATSVLDSMVSKGLYHKNTVARRKSRLNARIKALALS